MRTFLVIIVIVLFAVPAYAQCVIGWSNDAADLPGARIRGGGGVYDGQLYVFAGYDSNTASYLADTQIYDPAADAWTAGAAAPVATLDNGYAVAPEGYGYIVAGNLESITFTNAVHQYDIEADSWTTLSYTYPLTAWSPACAAPGDGYVYCFGGTTDGVNGNTYAAKYEIGSDDPWTAIAALPSAMMFGDAIAMDGMIYIVGGWSAADTAFVYDPDSDSYTTLDTLTTGRQRPSIVAAGGLLWVAGGGNMWTPIGSAEYFDGTNWIDAGASMDVPVLGGIAGYLHGYGMFLAGGRNGSYADTTHNQLFQVCVPAFDSITPEEGDVGDTVTIAGAAFAADVDVVFFDALTKAEYPLDNLTIVDDETITGDVPAGMVVGVYGLRFTGALGQLE
ncbi:MAG TPA: hypothetical protein PK961_03140, partial [bacterium]|nr:hypothetical protein [bacterium]